MRRILITLLVLSTAAASGCSHASPWSLARGESSSNWGPSKLNYLVQQEEMAKLKRDRAEKERLAESEDRSDSPKILSDVQPLDPAELAAEVRTERRATERRAGERLIRLVSNTQSNAPERTRAIQNNPLTPQSAKRATPNPLVPKQPTAELVSQPLHPIRHPSNESASNGENTQYTSTGGEVLNADLLANADTKSIENIDDEYDVQLRQLPPMNPVGTEPKNSDELNMANKMLQPKQDSEEVSSDWSAIQQVAFQQPIEAAPSSNQDQQAAKPSRDTFTTDKEKPSRSTSNDEQVAKDQTTKASSKTVVTPPKQDEFTAEDFYAAGWCDQPRCTNTCVCPKTARIASEFATGVPQVVPANFQVADATQMNVPKFPVGLKPLRTFKANHDGKLPELPGIGSKTFAKPLPVPSATNSNDFQPDAAIVTAGGTEDENSGLVANTHFESDAAKALSVPARAPMTWRMQLEQTIQSIEKQILETQDSDLQIQLQGKLDLLKLLPSQLDDQQQQYLSALTELLKSSSGSHPQNMYTTGQTLDQLRGAVAYLESVASMRVTNANFCSKVIGFGQFDILPSNIFSVGQQTLVYCEIENHSAQPKVVDNQEMFSTRLSGSYIVYDKNNQVVQQDKFPVVEDLARQRRKDFYMHIPFSVGDLAPGKYTYQLMIDDIGGGKSASLQPLLEFEVR